MEQKDCKNCQHSQKLRGNIICGLTVRPSLSVLTSGIMANFAEWERREGKCGIEAKNFVERKLESEFIR